MRVLVVTDTDSYLKWGAAVATRMPAGWRTGIVILETPFAPSSEQVGSALAGTGYRSDQVPELSLADITERIQSDRPDVVVLAVRGLVIRVLIRTITDAASRRPIFVSGMPGISIPANRKALYYRSQSDLVLVHSKREIRGFRRLAAELGIAQDFGLASLPFLPARRPVDRPDGDIVFAAQAKVPASRDDRVRVLEWLMEAARRNSTRTVVVKLRARSGEQQTHAEPFPYDDLLAAMSEVPVNLVVSYRSMAEHLVGASGLVTVSSTAAVEAVATGVPIIAIDDFGVSDELINSVFRSSDLLAGSSALIAGAFRHPAPAWLVDNYFHGADAEDWVNRIETLGRLRSIGAVPPRAAQVRRFDGPLRQAWDRKLAVGRFDRSASGAIAMLIGVPARWAWVTTRRFRRAVLGALDSSPVAPAARAVPPTADPPTADLVDETRG